MVKEWGRERPCVKTDNMILTGDWKWVVNLKISLVHRSISELT